LTTVPADQPYW